MSNAQPLDPRSTVVPVTGANNTAKGSYLGSLPMVNKLTIITVLLGIPSVVLVGVLTYQQNQDIAIASQERDGAQYFTPLSRILQNMQIHRGASNGLLGGDNSFQANVDKSKKAVDEAIGQLDLVDNQFDVEFKTTELVKKLKTDWKVIKDQIDKREISASDSFKAHTTLIDEGVLNLVDLIANESGIVLDPKIDTYYLGSNLTNVLPDLSENLGQIRGTAARLYGAGIIGVSDSITLRVLFNAAETNFSELDKNNAYAGKGTASVAAKLASFSQKTDKDVQNILDIYQKGLLKGQVTGSAKVAFDTATTALNSIFTTYTETVNLFDSLVQDRINAARRNQIIALLALLALLAAAIVIVIAVVRSITRPIANLSQAAEEVGRGNLNVQVPVLEQDELGRLGGTFNGAIAQLRDFQAQQDLENQKSKQLQANIGEFLNVTMDIADGDLTKRGKVSDDVLGNVVDSINVMTEELGYVLKDVRTAATSVNTGSETMNQTTDAIAQSAQETVLEVGRVNGVVSDISERIRSTAQSASEAAQSTQQALLASEQGQKAVDATLEGMQAIRREVQNIAERMLGLEARSLEINLAADSIANIASQINLLSLHAALEAAGAGDAGVRFGTVASEVRELADSSATAAREVTLLVRAVQLEVKNVGLSVKEGQLEVEKGFKVASQAGERLGDINKSSRESARLVASISAATLDQVSQAEAVSQAAQSIANIARTSSLNVGKGQAAAAQLSELAKSLEGSLERFRLPS
jgi:twitching motility protein PilJ